MTCYDKYWRSGALGLITIKNIIVRNLLSPVITSFLFSHSRLPRPHLSLENISVLNRFLSSHCCRPDNPTGTFRALTFDTLEFPGTDFNRRNTHVTKQSRQWSLNGMRYVEHQTKTECVSCYLSHSSPMEEPRWLMGAEAVLGAVTVRSNDQRCINLFSLPSTQIATIMKTRTKCSEMFPWFIGIQPPVWLWCVTLIIVFWCSNHWLPRGG